MDEGSTWLDASRFLARPIAHRGWHNAAAGIVENSLPAFEAAVHGGYGIECDLQWADGGVPVVIHDDTLDRMTTERGPVAGRTNAQLACMPLVGCRCASTIASFADLLALVDGRVPIFAEVKSRWSSPDPRFIGHVAKLARGYMGPIALISFDPAIVAALATAAPEVPRGLVSGSYRDADGSPWLPNLVDDMVRMGMRELLAFEAVGASFVAYEVGALPTPRTVALRVAGVPVLAWTVRTPTGWQTARVHADQAIFEGDAPV